MCGFILGAFALIWLVLGGFALIWLVGFGWFPDNKKYLKVRLFLGCSCDKDCNYQLSLIFSLSGNPPCKEFRGEFSNVLCY